MPRSFHLRPIVWAITPLILGAPVSAFSQPANFQVAANGRALSPVVIAKNAASNTVAVAGELAEYLGRITGAKFEVTTGDGSKGIVLGTLAEFPNPSDRKSTRLNSSHVSES